MTPNDINAMIEAAALEHRCDTVNTDGTYTLSFRGTDIGTMKVVTDPSLAVQQIPVRESIPQHMRNRYKKAANAVVAKMFKFEARQAQ